MDVVQLRARVGMVFQKPNPFPKSIYENVAYGPRIHGHAPTKADMDVIVEKVAASRWSLERGEGPAGPMQALLCQAGSNSACASHARLR